MRVFVMALAVAVCLASAVAAVAAEAHNAPQPPAGEQLGPTDGREGPPREHPFAPPRPPFPPPPVIVALDADRDGELSAEEIENAAAALKTLDKDGDGALSRQEMHPHMHPNEQHGRDFGPGGGPRPEFRHPPRAHLPTGRGAGPTRDRPRERLGQFPGPQGRQGPRAPQCPRCGGPSSRPNALHGSPNAHDGFPGPGWGGPPPHHGPPPR